MKVVIKQCSNFFLGLSEYCDDYLTELEKQNGSMPNKKLKTSSGGITTQNNKQSSKKTKKAKEKVDPNMPKRPATAFFQFCASRKDKIKQQYPNFSATEITQLISKEWRELPQDKIVYYQDKYKEMYKDYKKKYDEYKAG